MPNVTHTQNGYGFTGKDVVIIPNAGAPTGTTGVGYAGVGSLCIDYINANLYINSGTKTVPVWKLVTRAA